MSVLPGLHALRRRAQCGLFLLAVVAVVAGGCAPGEDESAPVQSGAEVLAENDFASLSGQRVGLIANHTTRVDTSHLADRLAAAPTVELGAIFSPEHGFRGTAGAGEKVGDDRDPRTGAPVYSLYGDTRRPTPEMLEGLDVLVFDVQDVGARFYTYITTMGLSMQAAAEADLPFVVLDRPNPLGGTYTDGFVLEPPHASFVGRYPIPITHGLTIGELARYIQSEKLLAGVGALDLSVVELKNWSRDTQWPDTGRDWRPPSPNLPTWETALLYPGMCFFEGVRVSEGRGTERPFRQIGAPWPPVAAQRVVDTLRARDLAGVAVDTAAFTPRSMPGAPAPRFEGEQLYGLEVRVTDRRAVKPVRVGLHALHAVHERAQVRGDTAFVSRPEHLTRLAGTDRLLAQLQAGAPPEAIIASWTEGVKDFRDRRASVLLYENETKPR